MSIESILREHIGHEFLIDCGQKDGSEYYIVDEVKDGVIFVTEELWPERGRTMIPLCQLRLCLRGRAPKHLDGYEDPGPDMFWRGM